MSGQALNRRSDDSQLQAIAKAAAKEAIAELFEIFGSDVTTPEGRRAVALDMDFIRTARVGSERLKKGILISLGSAIVTGFSYVLWYAAKGVGFIK